MSEENKFRSQLRSNFYLKIPEGVVKKLNLVPNDFFEIEIKETEIIIRPLYYIDPEQAWFWSIDFKTKTHRAEDDIEFKRIKVFPTAEETVAFLKLEKEQAQIRGRPKLTETQGIGITNRFYSTDWQRILQNKKTAKELEINLNAILNNSFGKKIPKPEKIKGKEGEYYFTIETLWGHTTAITFTKKDKLVILKAETTIKQ